MRFGLRCTMALASLTVVGCQASVETDDQMMSYSIGREVGASLSTTGEHLDMAALIRGIEDALAELDPAVPEEDLSSARLRVGQLIQEEQRVESDAAGSLDESLHYHGLIFRFAIRCPNSSHFFVPSTSAGGM